MYSFRPKNPINKLTVLSAGAALFTAIIICRLFYLQVIKGDYYRDVAAKEHYGYTELPARRGEIIIKDYHSEEEFLLATNITLETMYADPAIITAPQQIVENIAPLIYDKTKERAKDDFRISEAAKRLPAETTEEEKAILLKPKTDDELYAEFKGNFLEKISQKKRPQIILAEKLTSDEINKINAFKLNGVEVKLDTLYAYPPLITSTQAAAEHLAPIIKIPTKKLEQILQGKNRYVIIAEKLNPDISQKIHALFNKNKETYAGIGMQEEYLRYYPENTLGANVIGFVDKQGMGQYGIEGTFNTELSGKKGVFQAQRDSIGRQVIMGDSVIEPAIDGNDIVLTIDRSIQQFLEKTMAEDTKEYNADSGQAIIMDPKTGNILAMVNYPTFNPNSYTDIYKKVYINFTPEEIAQLVPTDTEGLYMFYRNVFIHDYYFVFEEKTVDETGLSKTEYYRYENFVGPEAYQNRTVSLPYEPGSTFKPIIMSIAIDDGDLTPTSTFNDYGPVGVDWNKHKGDYDYFIHNSLDRYYGAGTTMIETLQQSLNTGMTYVAKTIGPALMYNYILKYGFAERTDIEFNNEAKGQIAYYESWTESELATHSFGQGLTVTLLQLVNAYSTIANGGILMKPHIVEEIREEDNKTTKSETYQIRRVISEETSAKIRAMLTATVETGVAANAKLPNHFVAGKTGTSQTYKNGVALTGAGTTIGSFCGFGPVDDPKFVICLKFDRPRSTVWGDPTAAKTSSKITSFLYNYYNIPPDKK